MGSFIGHVVPGTFFITFGIWWMINIFWRYFSATLNQKHHGKGGKSFKSTISFTQCDLFCLNNRQKHVPIEIYLKLIALISGIIGEYLTALDESWTFKHQGNLQHIMMYAFFAFHPILELFYHYNYKVDVIPKNLDYLAAILAFTVEGFLFHEHLHGRKHMDIQVHTYLMYTIGCCIGSVILEMNYIHDVRPALARATFTLFQGTWFYQVGFILYPPSGFPKWNTDDHDQMMVVTVLFTMHLAIILMFEACLGAIIYRKAKRTGSFHVLKHEDDDSECDLILENKQCNA